jgi:lipopolysaccharide/colanic/teichoic acid biosynthesis glycosyltransferase
MMLKFRTMTVDAEKGIGAVWAKENDPRVTPIGSILRKTHLDELPQFFNVLMGEMNIVGPRPERPEIVKDLRKNIADYDKRLEILPGITGLAQVLHRADESLQDVRRKVKYDLFYIKKMCWLMEIRVLTSTMFVMLTGKTVQFNKVRSS